MPNFIFDEVQTKAHFTAEIKGFADEKNTYQFVITSEAIDRHGDIVRMSGANLEAFRRNPVVLYNHDSYSMPIGRAKNIIFQNNSIIADVEFHGKTEESRLVADLVADGYMRTVSIGFIPRKMLERRATDEEKSLLPAWKDSITEYESWDLLEFSIVTIPANPDALILNSAQSVLDSVGKAGRVLSKSNYAKLKAAYEAIGDVLNKVDYEEEEDKSIEVDAILEDIAALKDALKSQSAITDKLKELLPKKITLKD